MVVEISAALLEKLKLNGSVGKIILREDVRDSLLHRQIIVCREIIIIKRQMCSEYMMFPIK